ncbi:hypothetical protein DFJ73DRAFT_801962 [Zopfochytrium polystomum]|nr:hypothetical protein DFJ73DRAFT_801962 [Zopfochytrium polystomum]
MRCFISDVDSALGHNLSRLLSQTQPGARRGDGVGGMSGGGDLDDDGASSAAAGGADAAPPPPESYKVWGTLQAADGPAEPPVEGLLLFGPGTVTPVDTGDKMRDLARREAIDKVAVPGAKPKWVQEIVPRDDQNAMKEALLASDIIIFDLLTSLDEAAWAIEMLSEMSESFVDHPKTFIAVSTIMTWAKTKVDQDDPDAFLAEDEYRRRKPHPNYKNHVNVEKSVIRCGKKSALRTFVVASGLVYHAGDNLFHYMFKSAWHNADIPCYGDGSNALPTIHLDDLCNIIVEVADVQPETRYLLAIDDSKSTLMELTKGISETLGTGRIRKMPKEAALLNKNMPQSDYDMLHVNLRLEPGHVKDMSFEWKYDAGILENLPQLIQEYKDARGLSPLKIVLHGPPASGKSTIARALAEYYDIHLLDVEAVVHDAIARLERRAAGNLRPEEADDDIDADRELLDELREAARANNGRYPEEQIVNFVRDRLRSMPCRNQGYVLDGFPTTNGEAVQLFRPLDDDGKDGMDEIIGPEFVLSLECTDEFIKERVMNLPESAVAGTKNAEEALIKRLEEFRAANTEENTVLNYYDELEIHPHPVTIDTNHLQTVLDGIIKKIGKPHNYGPTPEQIAEKRRAIEEQKAKESAQAEEERLKREKEESERHAKSVTEWNLRMEEIRKQEQEVLEAQSVPLRNYLMKYVMPTLTAGLIDVCKVRPEDPIDFLAEYLFKHNVANMAD